MSHYSVCVVVPSSRLGDCIDELHIDRVLEEILEPYYEGAEEPEYTEFVDETESVAEDYRTNTLTAIRYPDGKTVPTFDREFCEKFTVEDGKIIQFFTKEDGGNRESEESRQLTLIPDYPVKSLLTFEQYCRDYHGYRKLPDGRVGYYHNPNANWDWYEIGGRFPGLLLVKDDVKDILPLSESEDKNTRHPTGYRYVNGARMKDIEWYKMRELRLDAVKANYARLAEAFRTKDLSKIGGIATINEEGIFGWGCTLFSKDETLEEYLDRKGATEIDMYPICTYAFVNAAGEWNASGDMGWFGLSSNDKPERTWLDETRCLVEKIREDDFMVIVDCHI